MIFDTLVPVGKIAHLSAWFGEKMKVFWTAFNGAGFAAIWARWVGIASNGQEHFVNDCGDCSGFVFGPLSGGCKVAHGIEATLKGVRGVTH